MADYLEAFARESEEQITELNNALLTFEDDPTDEGAMDRIFRTAHTLKGNCGAMGFEEAEDLAHALEDLLESIRQKRVSVTPELMDAVFAGVDELDAMISEAVEHGEVQRDATEEIERLREYAAADGLAEPTDAEIEELLESVSGPSDSEHSVYHVRLDVAGDPAVHGRAVVDALDDAFELLGTTPDGDVIDDGDYDGTIDAAFASVVERGAVEAALEPVDAVADQVIADVTDRAAELADEPAASDEAAGGEDAAAPDAAADDGGATDAAVADAAAASDADEESSMADMSVDELLADEEVDQFDDLDEMAEEVGDTSEFENLGDAGSFADLGITEDDVDVGSEADDSAAAADAESAGADAGTADDAAATADDSAGEPADDGEVEDAAAEFAQLKEEVDPVGFDELQEELADLEFDEYDSDDEVGFDELLDEDELEDDGAFAESAVTASAAEDAAPDLTEGADPDDGEPASAETAGADATAEDLFGGGPSAADDSESGEPADASASEAAVDETTDVADPDVGADETGVVAEAVDAETTDADAVDAETADADEAGEVEEEAGEVEEEAGEVETGPAADESIEADAMAEQSDPETAEAETAAVETADVETAEADTADVESADVEPTAVETAEPDTADADTVDLDAPEEGEMLPTESLDEGAQSFGEGGLDLSEETEPAAAETDEVPAGADELDLDDSFGEMEAGVAEEAEQAAADDAEAGFDDGFDLGEDDIDFGEGTVAGAEDEPAETADEGVAVGGGLEDDSFGDEVTADDLAADAEVDDADADESVEPVEEFGGDEDVLDLDGEVAGAAATSSSEDAADDEPDVDELVADAELDDADALLEDDDASLEAGAGDADAAAGATPGSALDDPGFSDAPETADDGPEVDEERLERIRNLGVPARDGDVEAGAATTQSIRVDVDSLDRMLNLVEGLVTSRARLRRALIENEPREVLDDELDDLEDVTSELQDTVMDVRLVPLRTAVNKLPRIVRDVAREQDKQVAFEMVGEDVELDRSILDEIGDPLVHLVRNAVDHGIESPAVREAADKDPEGSVELRAIRERDRVTIEVEDDGAGIDPDAVRDAAVEEGIHTRSEVDSMDDADVHDLIFHAGFSTASEVTDVSGRGVGMDVVAETVERLDGSVSVDSEPGEGTTITMELPVTLAIAEVLFVDVGGEEYGIPIKTVDEIGPVVGVETQDGQEVLVSDGGENERELIRLDDALSTPGRSDPNAGMLVHLRDDVREAAIHCDSVREQQEVVVKPFEGVLGDVPGIGGASVLGDGDVVNILDVETL